jgi:phage major head subunit gpT-like protein
MNPLYFFYYLKKLMSMKPNIYQKRRKKEIKTEREKELYSVF